MGGGIKPQFASIETAPPACMAAACDAMRISCGRIQYARSCMLPIAVCTAVAMRSPRAAIAAAASRNCSPRGARRSLREQKLTDCPPATPHRVVDRTHHPPLPQRAWGWSPASCVFRALGHQSGARRRTDRGGATATESRSGSRVASGASAPAAPRITWEETAAPITVCSSVRHAHGAARPASRPLDSRSSGGEGGRGRPRP